MRTLLRTFVMPVVVGILLLGSVSFAIATSRQTVPRATDEVYPCIPDNTGGASAPNQGDSGKVLTADNPNVGPVGTRTGCKCPHPVPLAKVEGNNLGKTLYVSASKPIDFVTIKSGSNATIISQSWQIYNGTIKLSQAVSNYVIWVCP